MTSLRRSIPSLGALATFEAAARLGGFTLAAAELGVSQAAVSRQIKLLETDLNAPLFVRAHRKVSLTSAGEVLAAAVTGSFARMAEAIDTIRQPQLPNTVTVGATLAFSHFWLLPRLPAFRSTHPWVNLRLVAEDTPFSFEKQQFDVVLRYGTAPFADARSVALCAEEIYPVCSPAFAARHALGSGEIDLLSLPLIGLDWVDPDWLKWKNWAQQVGFARAPKVSSLSFNHYTDAVHAALSGEGVVLGWATLLSDLLREGRLIRLGGRSVVPPQQYHVLTRPGQPQSAASEAFVAWISAQFAQYHP